MLRLRCPLMKILSILVVVFILCGLYLENPSRLALFNVCFSKLAYKALVYKCRFLMLLLLRLIPLKVLWRYYMVGIEMVF